MRTFLLLTALVGCSPTSYRDAVVVYPSNAGRFVIEAKGNKRTSPGMLQSYVETKASELCPSGFDILGSNDAAKTDYTVAGDTAIAQTKHDVTATVVCK